MRKKLGAFFFIIILLSSLFGCTGGSYTITIGDIESTSHSISGQYDRFTGKYFKKVTVDDGEAIEITLTTHTESGELIAKVIDTDGDTITTVNAEDTVNIAEPGQYKMQVEGDKHKGSFLLAWDEEEK